MLPIQDVRVLSEKTHCGINCSECTYSVKCRHLDIYNIRYRPQTLYISEKSTSKETPLDSSDYLILPKIKSKSSSVKKKLFDLLLAVILQEGEKCNVETLANYLGVSLLQIQKRLSYLDDNEIMQVNYRSESVHLCFVDKTLDKDEKYKAIMSTYIQEFKSKVGQSPHIEKLDYVAIRQYCKKTEYTPTQLVVLIKEYLNTNQLFLRNIGYRLRSFPSYINSILLSKPNLLSDVVSVSGPSKEQLMQYERGKAEGKWTGTEEWAKTYEAFLQKQKDEFKPLRIQQ